MQNVHVHWSLFIRIFSFFIYLFFFLFFSLQAPKIQAQQLLCCYMYVRVCVLLENVENLNVVSPSFVCLLRSLSLSFSFFFLCVSHFMSAPYSPFRRCNFTVVFTKRISAAILTDWRIESIFVSFVWMANCAGGLWIGCGDENKNHCTYFSIGTSHCKIENFSDCCCFCCIFGGVDSLKCEKQRWISIQISMMQVERHEYRALLLWDYLFALSANVI